MVFVSLLGSKFDDNTSTFYIHCNNKRSAKKVFVCA